LLNVFRQSDDEVAKHADAPCTQSGPVKCELGELTEGFLENVPEGISPKHFKQLIDEFAELENTRAFNKWKKNLQESGLTAEQIKEATYRGSLQRGENIFGSWGRYYEEISGTVHPGAPYHAHHLVQKGTSIEVIVENRQILIDAGMSPDLARENFTWAHQTAKGMHGTAPQTELNSLLNATGGDRKAILEVLAAWAKRCESLG